MATIIVVSSDLVMASQARAVAAKLGLDYVAVASTGDCSARVATGQRSLVLVDLGMKGLAIDDLVRTLRAVPGANVQILAFGPHVHEPLLHAARDANCECVMSRGQLHAQLEEVLAEFAGL